MQTRKRKQIIRGRWKDGQETEGSKDTLETQKTRRKLQRTNSYSEKEEEVRRAEGEANDVECGVRVFHP